MKKKIDLREYLDKLEGPLKELIDYLIEVGYEICDEEYKEKIKLLKKHFPNSHPVQKEIKEVFEETK